MNKTRQIALVSVLSALTVAGRLAPLPIPNVKPAMALVILAGALFGWRVGALVGFVSATVAGVLTGIGVWTPAQIVAFTVIGGVAGVVPRNKLALLIYGVVAGFAYGVFMVPTYIPFTNGFNSLMVMYVQGLYFDGLSALGNIVFVAVLYPLLTKVKGLL